MGILTAIGLNFGLIVWLIGIVAGIALAIIVLAFNIQKYAIIAITAVVGTGIVIFTILASVGGLTPAEETHKRGNGRRRGWRFALRMPKNLLFPL